MLVTLGALSRRSQVWAHSWQADLERPRTERCTGHGHGRPEHPHPPREHSQTDNQGLRMGWQRGEGDFEDRRPREDAGSPPLLLSPGTQGPVPQLPPCNVCVTTPTQASGAVRLAGSGQTAGFHCLFCTALKLFSTVDREASLLRAGINRTGCLGAAGFGGPQQACTAQTSSAGQ